jgi:D-glycero-alpha-D-manno-heptose-7-phosphate kinase
MIVRSKAPLRLDLPEEAPTSLRIATNMRGVVLNATIDLYAYCTIIPTDDGKISFYASDRDEYFETPASDFIPIEGSLQLHKGVYNRIVKDFKPEKDYHLE